MNHLVSISILENKKEELIKLLQDSSLPKEEYLAYRMMFDDIDASIAVLDKAFYLNKSDENQNLVDTFAEGQYSLTVNRDLEFTNVYLLSDCNKRVTELNLPEELFNGAMLKPSSLEIISNMYKTPFSENAKKAVSEKYKNFLGHKGLYDYVSGDNIYSIELEENGGDSFEVCGVFGLEIPESPFDSLTELENFLTSIGLPKPYCVPPLVEDQLNKWVQVSMPSKSESDDTQYFVMCYMNEQNNLCAKLVYIDTYIIDFLDTDEKAIKTVSIAFSEITPNEINLADPQSLMYEIDIIHSIRGVVVENIFELIAYRDNEYSFWSHDIRHHFRADEEIDSNVESYVKKISNKSGFDLYEFYEENINKYTLGGNS